MLRLRFPALAAAAALPFTMLALPAQAAAQPASPAASPAGAAALQAAIASPLRSAANRARDQYRHPAETLAFFGIRPDMTVIEISPGAGWYTEILAPFLKERGHLVEALNDPASSPNAKAGWDRFQTFLGENRAAFGEVKTVAFGKTALAGLGADGSADMVLTFRNSHDWRNGGIADDVFAAFYKVLKPGGVLGLVDHRLPESMAETEETKKASYIKESTIIAIAEKAGFRLAGRSDVNGNPKDTHDWPRGVFTLPPSLALGDQDRARYLAVGESDRMTLKFVKP